MKVLLFDISNLMMRCLFSQTPGPEETEFSIFKMTFLSSFIKTIREHSPDRVICVQDSESWRKEVYPEYKANREAKRDSSIVNFDVFFPVVEKFFTVLKESFRNIPFVQIPRCEADDIIAVITKNRPNWDIINVSSDKDFHQLYVYPNYRQYDGVKHCFVECLDPEKELTLKIITGDRGDNVPGIKYGIGEKRALKILDEDLDLWLAENSLKETFERNMKLISFRCIPKDIENTILSVINNLTYDTVDTKRYFKFIQMSGLAGLMDTFTDYMNTVKQVH